MTMPQSNKVSLYCADGVTPGGAYADDSVWFKVLDVSGNTATVMIASPSQQTQSGIGIFSFNWRVKNGHIKLEKEPADKSTTNGNDGYADLSATLGVEDESNHRVVTLYTDRGGYSTFTAELAPGHYRVYEDWAPAGYDNNFPKDSQDPWVWLTVNPGETTYYCFYDTPQNDLVAISVYKTPTGLTTADPSLIASSNVGDADMSGTQFTVKYYKNTNGDISGAPERTWVIQTVKYPDGTYCAWLSDTCKVSGDEFYKSLVTGGIMVPIGTISVQETKAVDGFELDPTIRVVTIQQGDWNNTSGKFVFGANWSNTNGNLNIPGVPTEYTIVAEQEWYSGVEVVKQDTESATNPQGDANLAGAEYQIINRSAAAVDVDGHKANPGEVAKTITTERFGSEWKASSGNVLPYGSYELVESKAPDGYNLDVYSQKFQIRTNGQLVALTDSTTLSRDTVQRGSVEVMKADKDLNVSRAQGDTTLEGVQYTITNTSQPVDGGEGTIIYKGRSVRMGELIDTITTTWDNSTGAYVPEPMRPHFRTAPIASTS